MRTIIISAEAADDLCERLENLIDVGIDPNGDFQQLVTSIRDHSTLCLMIEATPSPVQRRSRLPRHLLDDLPPWRP